MRYCLRQNILKRILLVSCFALGPSLAAKSEDDAIQFQGIFEWLNFYVDSQNTVTPYNEENKYLYLFDRALVSEFRPNFKFLQSRMQLVVRPRVTLSNAHVTLGENVDGKTSNSSSFTRQSTTSYLSEGFINWQITDSTIFALGRQSFQWGPAESLSPSNRIFHETALKQNGLYEGRGKNLARLNLTPHDAFNVVLLTEYDENPEEDPYRADEVFASKSLVKVETNWSGGADYVGFVFGGIESGEQWMGEYINWNLPFLKEGLSVYADAAQQKSSLAYYPLVLGDSTQGPIISFEQTERDETQWKKFHTLGLRYDFENGIILRTEYIQNDLGYSKTQQQNIYQSLLSDNPQQLMLKEHNIRRMLAPGLDLIGRNYAYFSFYYPEVFKHKKLNLMARNLYSLTDSSHNSLIHWEYNGTDHLVGFLSQTYNQGSRSSELGKFMKATHILGIRHVW